MDNSITFLCTIKTWYHIVKQCLQVYLLLPTPNGWETQIWFFHRNNHNHKQLIANNCHCKSKAVTLLITATAQMRSQSCQIQLIRRKVVAINKRKSVKAGQALNCYFGKCMERKFRWFGSNQLRQTKSQLRTLKESYKNAKENNNKTGASPIFSPHFHVFDEVLGTRDTVNLRHVLETILLKMFKGTVVQVEKTVINVRLRVSKSSWKFRFPTIYNFSVMYQWNLLFL